MKTAYTIAYNDCIVCVSVCMCACVCGMCVCVCVGVWVWVGVWACVWVCHGCGRVGYMQCCVHGSVGMCVTEHIHNYVHTRNLARKEVRASSGESKYKNAHVLWYCKLVSLSRSSKVDGGQPHE